MSRGLCRVGAGGLDSLQEERAGLCLWACDRPPSSWPVTTPVQTTAGKLSIYYLVLLNEPDGSCLVPTIVLAAHQWPLLLHPVLQL